ncbi:inositol polyphosphate multikinase-like [Montipora foliosa]|uniref:inositol polyphosphate multikinase-like n=1 Tax=Montipora foliosa TaxID=591990 RepID=UPI0035F17F03
MNVTNAESSDVLDDYPYQVAGHANDGPLRLTDDGSCVLKPVQKPPKGEREVVFYETIFSNDEQREEVMELRRFLPHYYGVIELDSSKYLKLENVTSKFVHPCVMDIKIGRITWEDDVDEWVIKKKDKWPLRKLAGFSILGYMVFNPKTCSNERFSREWCRKMTSVEDAEKSFKHFLDCVKKELKHRVVEELITKLREIQRWFKSQRMFKFIASSILIAYEGKDSTIPHASLKDQELNNEMPDLNNMELLQVKNCQPEKALVEVRMIDAAHVFSSSVVDSNYLSGLENVVASFEHIRANLGK